MVFWSSQRRDITDGEVNLCQLSFQKDARRDNISQNPLMVRHIYNLRVYLERMRQER